MNKNIKESAEKEIEVLNIFLEHYRFEQNHIANDLLTRMVFMVTLGVTLSLALLNYGYWYISIIIYISAFYDLFRYSNKLKTERDQISSKTIKIREELMKRYELLGINTQKLIDEFN